MAIVYYPSSSFMFRRDTISSSFEQVVLSTQPNTILYFGSGSEISELSASTIYITSSWAVTSSYAMNGGGSSIETGSTYPFTSSWSETASYSITASYVASSSYYPAQIVQTTVLSASWVSSSVYIENAQTASYITADNIADNYSSSVSSQIGSKEPTLINQLYVLTASLATSASYYPAQIIQTTVLSASWVSASVKITTADTASYILPNNIANSYSSSVSSQIGTKQDSLIIGGKYTITSSWATSSISASYIIASGIDGTVASTTQAIFATQSIYATSASWVSASVKITTADTASYITAGNISDNYSASVSTQIGLKQDTLTNSLYIITASLATSASYYPSNVLSSSFASSSISASYANTSSFPWFTTGSNIAYVGGNVGIGTANPTSGKLQVVGNVYAISFTGSLLGTSSWANNSITSSNALTASSADSFQVRNNLTVDGILYASQLSSSLIYITSSQLTVTDNIIKINALTPHLRYAGLEMYDSGSTDQLASFLWDGTNNYFFLSSSDAGYSRKIITGPANEGDLTNGYIPIATGSNGLIDSIVSQTGTSINVSGNVKADSFTGSLYLSQSYIISNTASTPPAFQQAMLFWDNNAKTYAMYGDDPNVTLQIGQEQWVRAYADEYIPNGSAVYVHSSLNNLPCVRLALSDGLVNTFRNNVIGLATENISSGSIGVITSQGQVHDLDTSTYTPGQLLFLSNINSGSFIGLPPEIPYEEVGIGYVLTSNAINGIVQVNIISSAVREFIDVGMTSVPTITGTGGGSFTIGTASVNLCSTTDGRGPIFNYQLNSASFTVTASIVDVQYLIASYDGGSPVYSVVTDLTNVDDIQSTPVATFTIGTSGNLSYIDWDTSGILLSNKLNKRIIDLYGAQRASGLMLSTSASHITLTAGTGYIGVKKLTFTTSSTVNTSQFVLLSHSASVWSGSVISGWINTKYDNGTNLVNIDNNKYVVNYVYRGIGSLNRSQVILSTQYNQYADAVASLLPTPPTELGDIAILTGRIITQQGNAIPLLVESAFTTILSVAGVTIHNDLLGLQGGTVNEYYHLPSASYSNVISNTSSYSFTSSYVLNSVSSSYAPPHYLGDLVDVDIISPQIDDLLGYNGVGWVNRASSMTSAGSSVNYYLDPQIVAGNNGVLSTTPYLLSQITASVVVNNSIGFIRRYVSPVITGNIESGVWKFHTYAALVVGTTVGNTVVHTRINRSTDITGSVTITGTGLGRTASFAGVAPLVQSDTGSTNNILSATLIQTPSQSFWVTSVSSSAIAKCQATDAAYLNETNVSSSLYYLLFKVATTDINNTTVTSFDIVTTQPAFPMLTGDKIVAAYFAQTDNAANKTVAIYLGGTSSYSYIETPLITRHNDLAGLQGGFGGQYYHLTVSEYTGSGTGLFVRQTGATITATGSLLGTSSWSNNAITSSNALTSSYPWFTTGNNIAYVGGNVGIGNINPVSAKLYISQSVNDINSGLHIANTSNQSGRMWVDSTGNVRFSGASNESTNILLNGGGTGNIGIGTNNPTEKLTIVGGKILLDNAQSIQIKNNAGVVNDIINYYSDNNLYVGPGVTGGNIYFRNPTTIMTISASGNVGIGTTTPISKLTVQGDISASSNIVSNAGVYANAANGFFSKNYIASSRNPIWAFGDATTYGLSYFQGSAGIGNADTIGFHFAKTTSSESVLRIAANTITTLPTINVGIGTTTPFSPLHIAATGVAGVTRSLTLENHGTTDGIGTSIYMGYQASATSPFGIRLVQKGYPASVRNGSFEIQHHNLNVGDDAINWATSIFCGYDTKVGIGTIIPSASLEVQGTTIFGDWRAGAGITVPQTRLQSVYGAGLILQNSHNAADVRNWAIKTDGYTYGDLHFIQGTAIGVDPIVSGSTKMVISKDGNVGIGFVAPTYDLHISGSHNSNLFNIQTPIASNILTVTGSNIGMGTATPSKQLHIYGAGQATSALENSGSTGASIYIQSSDGLVDSGGALYLGANQGYFGAIKGCIRNGGDNTQGNIAFSTRNNTTDTALTERMLIQYDGKVGIGTSAPLYKVQIGTTASVSTTTPDCISLGGTYSSVAGANPKLRLWDNNTSTIYGIGVTSTVGMEFLTPTNACFAWYVNAVEKMRLNENGYLGIGNGASPIAYPLDVRGSAGIYGSGIDSTLGDSIIFGNVNYPTSYKNKIQNAVSSVAAGSYINFTLSTGAATSASVLTLRGDGTVGIGVTVPSYKLDVRNGIVSNVAADVASLGYRIQNSGTGGRTYALVSGIRNVGQVGFSIYDETATVTRLVIDASGNVGIGTTTPYAKLEIIKDTTTLGDETNYGLSILTSTSGVGITKLILGTLSASAYSVIQSMQAGISWTTRPLILQPNGGNVGIGTTTPANILEVKPASAYSAISTGDGLLIKNSTLTSAELVLGINGGNSNIIQSRQSGPTGYNLALNPFGGNVGIGTTSPNAKLSISGSLSYIVPDGAFFDIKPYNQYGFGFRFKPHSATADRYMQIGPFNNANAFDPVVTIDNNNYVGIGTTIPLSTLHVNGNLTLGNPPSIPITAASQNIANYFNNFNSYTGLALRKLGVGTGDYIACDDSSSNAQFYVKSDGKVGIGTATPGAILHVQGNISCSNLLGSASYATSASYAPGGSSLSGTTNYIPKWNGGGTSLTSTSSIYDGAITFTASYDPAFTLWTARTSITGINNWQSIVYGSGTFVAGGSNATSNTTETLMTSPDGINWTSVNNAAYQTYNDIIYVISGSVGKFVAVGSNVATPGNCILTSSNGTDWRYQNGPAGLSTNVWRAVTYASGTYVAVGQYNDANFDAIMTSPDAITWTIQVGPNLGSQAYWYDICYAITGSTSASAIFVAVGGNSYTSIQSVITSTDGINWTGRTSSYQDYSFYNWKAITYGSGTFVVGGMGYRNGCIMTSPDGLNWTGRTSSYSTATLQTWNDIAYVSGTFVAVGSNGSKTNCIMTSPDAITWASQINSAPISNVNALTAAKNMIVAVGYGGSTSGSVFTSAATSSLITTSMDVVNIKKPLYVNGDITTTGITSSVLAKIATKTPDGTYLPVNINGVIKYIPLYT